jgi:formylmethanofuran dehydrogenase subunit B
MDTYKVGALPANVMSIVSVSTVLDAKTDTGGLGGGAQVAPVIGNGATTATGSAASVNTSYAELVHHWGTNPLTSAAWAVSDWGTLEIGHTRTA